MLYVIAVGMALCILAWIAERLLAQWGWSRRFVWVAALLASVIVPLALMSRPATLSTLESGRPAAATIGTTLGSDGFSGGPTDSERHTVNPTPRPWLNRPELDRLLVSVWAALSGGLSLWLLVASWALSRKLRHWPIETIDGHVVRIAQSTGPAVCGAFAPSIVIPRWVASAPNPVRELILLHEHSHLRARDPLMFRIALLLVVLAPWNVPAWWLLHRLRFAIEVDCDARVLGATQRDAVTYGEVLLTIGQRPSHLPAGSMALNESSSQLERRIRIMMFSRPRLSALATGTLALLAGGVVTGAASLDAPRLTSDKPAAIRAVSEFLIPPPKWLDLRWREIDASLRSLLERQYPQFLSYDGDEIPLIEVLFKRDGSVERSELRMLANRSELGYGIHLFAHTDAKTEALAYVQPRELQPPGSEKRIYFHFGERKNPANTYAYANSLGDVAGDSAAQNRFVLSRYFPDVAQERVSGGPILWILLDRRGNILESGRESASPELNNSSEILSRIMARYPEIRTNGGRMEALRSANRGPLEDGKGNQVILSYFWLEHDSPMPGSWARR
jgi:beta-lactamase regulating signal transducer with metallopeptidase domain